MDPDSVIEACRGITQLQRSDYSCAAVELGS